MKLYYPDAIIPLKTMHTLGYYQLNYPRGAVIHFTAGNEDDSGENSYEIGRKNKHTYFVISSKGKVWQGFPLNRFGSHAGKSYYPSIGSSVSQHLVGIEICCAGKLEYKSHKYRSWFGKIFQKEQVRSVVENKDNWIIGHFHKYAVEQEIALYNLILWLWKNNPNTFNIDKVLGHDEVCAPKGRKNDPGASLSVTMPAWRANFKELTKSMS
ncbi:MAG: hypothetical protein RLY43_1321 [Bacteroidota bacterium]|jgi:N-acetyl-anhydromuramyl-L-alanine amidase AmpD